MDWIRAVIMASPADLLLQLSGKVVPHAAATVFLGHSPSDSHRHSAAVACVRRGDRRAACDGSRLAMGARHPGSMGPRTRRWLDGIGCGLHGPKMAGVGFLVGARRRRNGTDQGGRFSHLAAMGSLERLDAIRGAQRRPGREGPTRTQPGGGSIGRGTGGRQRRAERVDGRRCARRSSRCRGRTRPPRP